MLAYPSGAVAMQFSSMTLSMSCDMRFSTVSYPKLKSRGAEVKDLVKPLLLCWEHFRAATIGYEYETVLNMLQNQIALQELLSDYSADLFLPVPEAQK